MTWLGSAHVQGLPPGGPMVLGLPPRVLLRYMGFGTLFVASLMFYVWSRTDVRSTSAELDEAVALLQQLEVDRERLELELATRRDVSRLEAASRELGLVDDAPVVEIR